MVHLVAKGRLSAGTNPRCEGLSVIANASYRSNCKIFTRLFSFILRPVFSQRALVSQTTGLKCEKRSILFFFSTCSLRDEIKSKRASRKKDHNGSFFALQPCRLTY